MNRKGQIGFEEIGTIAVIGAVIVIFLILFNALTSSINSGSVDSIVNAFIPLLFLAIFFEFIRRLFS